MRILSREFARHYAGRMVNIHPSLLPKYPGLHTHERALAAPEREHGASVHLVTGELDAGPLLRQARVPVLPGDTPASLSARVQAQEHIIYPEVIGWFASGRLRAVDGLPWLDGRALCGNRWSQDRNAQSMKLRWTAWLAFAVAAAATAQTASPDVAQAAAPAVTPLSRLQHCAPTRRATNW